MKKILFINVFLVGTLFFSCSVQINNLYAGFVVEEVGKPISDVLIEQKNTSSLLKPKANKKGNFKFNRINGVISSLRLAKEVHRCEIGSAFDFTFEPKNRERDEIKYLSFLASDTTKITLQSEENIDYQNAHQWSVEDIKNIRQIPYIQNCNDTIFWGLVKQGKKNIPDLINKLTDETILKNVYVPMFGGEYTVADVSLVILNEKIKNIPIFELIGEKFSKECGYCTYWYFVREKKKNRFLLQKNLKNWYHENENKLQWVTSNSSLTGDCFSPANGHYEVNK